MELLEKRTDPYAASYDTDDPHKILVVRSAMVSSLEIQVSGINGHSEILTFTKQGAMDSHSTIRGTSSSTQFHLTDGRKIIREARLKIQQQFRPLFEPLKYIDDSMRDNIERFGGLFLSDEEQRTVSTRKFLDTPAEQLNGYYIANAYKDESDPELREQVAQHALTFLHSEHAKDDRQVKCALKVEDPRIREAARKCLPFLDRVVMDYKPGLRLWPIFDRFFAD